VGGIALGALALVGCGDDDDGEDAKGLLAEPQDTTKNAVAGGTLTRPIARDHTSFNTDSNLTDLQRSAFVYSRLTRFQAYKHPEKVQGVAEGDAATAWEISPDKLQYTFRLRKGMKFDPRPPTNGRELTAEDVMFSWQRYGSIGVYANQFLQSLAPQAPFVSMSAPSQDTITLTTAYPYAPSTIIAGYYAFMLLMPKESDGGFNPKTDARGTGALRLKEWVPSARIEFLKNPDWYDAAKAKLDGVTEVLMPEYATQLAQFRAGNLEAFGGTPLGALVNQEDVLPLKKDLPNVILMANSSFQRNSANSIRFSELPNSPFKDVRVRQAVSALIDRDLLIRTMYNVEAFEAEGLQSEIRWDTSLHAGEEWWLDPKGNEFGEAAKFLKYDPAETKRLLTAAAASTPIKSPFVWSNGYANQPYPREAEIVLEMLQAHGDFQLAATVLDHNSQYRPTVIFNKNMHEGMAYFGAGPSEPDVDVWLGRVFGAAASNSWGSDPKMDTMVGQQRRAFDREERARSLNDIQKYYPTEMRACWVGGAAQTYIVYQPWLGNAGYWRANGGGSEPNETWQYLWIDPKKKA
jgi:ABC-type transport system substrate-binding protein